MFNVQNINFSVTPLLPQYTYSEWKEWLTSVGGLPMRKKFTDVCDPTKVTELINTVPQSCIGEVFMYLRDAKTVKVENRFNFPTFIPHDTQSYAVENQVLNATVKNADPVSVDFSNGMSGKATLPTVVARTLVSGIRPYSEEKVEEKGKLYQDATLHESNIFSPIILTKALPLRQAIPITTPDAKLAVARGLNAIQDKASILRIFSQASPVVKGKHIIDVVDGKMSINKVNLAAHNFESEFDGIAKHAAIYLQGGQSGHLGKERQDAFLGVPCSYTLADVVHLRDAGVKNGDFVLVCTNDTLRIESLRATFGPTIFGLGSRDAMIPLNVARKRSWDWKFFPDPISFNLTGGMMSATKGWIDAYSKLRARLEGCTGSEIFITSPLIVFSSVMANMLGAPVKKFSALSEEKRALTYPIVTKPKLTLKVMKLEGHSYGSYLGSGEPVAQAECEPASYYTAPNCENAEVLPYAFISTQKFNATISMASTLGHVVFSPQAPAIGSMDLIGAMLGVARAAYVYIWNGQAISSSKYGVTMITRKISGLMAVTDDDYSPFISSEILEIMELEQFAADPKPNFNARAAPPLPQVVPEGEMQMQIIDEDTDDTLN